MNDNIIDLESQNALKFVKTVIENEVVGKIANQLAKYYTIRKLTEIINDASLSRKYTFQRMHQLIQRYRKEAD